MLYLPYPAWIKPEIIPNLPFRWYGLMYLVAFVITYLLFSYQVKQKKLPLSSDNILSLFFWSIIGLLIGARLFATTIYDPTNKYLSQPWLIFWPFDEKGNFTGLQGMSYHGGLLGVVLGYVLYCRVKKISVLETGDLLANAVPLGYTFGRLGNFINGELYGKVSDAPWAILFPHARPLPTSETWVVDMAEKVGIPIPDASPLINLPRHPSQLYEAFFEGILLWALLWFLVRPRKTFRGMSISLYLIGYSLFRFIIEYVREPDPGLEYVVKLGPQDNPPELFLSLLNFSTGQVLNFLMLLAGVFCFILFKKLDGKRPRAETFVSAESEIPNTKKNERRNLRKKLK